mmetsp:Transcript_105106/g.307138  ORF Transcript_105106/g.307138 Transcript_105106/m.307138 type:complete len:283 (+) Transcript_105106:1717-2565(+)
MLPQSMWELRRIESARSVRADHQANVLVGGIRHLDHKDVFIGKLKLVALRDECLDLVPKVVCVAKVDAEHPASQPLLTARLVPEVGEVDPVALLELLFPPTELHYMRAHQGKGLPQVLCKEQVVGAGLIALYVQATLRPVRQQRPSLSHTVESKALYLGLKVDPLPSQSSIRREEAVVPCTLGEHSVCISGAAEHSPYRSVRRKEARDRGCSGPVHLVADVCPRLAPICAALQVALGGLKQDDAFVLAQPLQVGHVRPQPCLAADADVLCIGGGGEQEEPRD